LLIAIKILKVVKFKFYDLNLNVKFFIHF